MLSREQNDLITQTGPGTPGGEMMRRYWQPVALARELTVGEPLPVKVMGEDLVLYEDADGTLGLVGRRCPHRGVDLSYGRVEDGNLRCIYHGWLFNNGGQCLAQPGEPTGRDFADRIRIPAYPCVKAAGMILAYMGPGAPPPLPDLPFLHEVNDPRVWTVKLIHECNWLQANEGNIDPQHLSYLHRFIADDSALMPELNRLVTADEAPRLEVKETGYGLEILAVRDLPGGDRYVRITNFVMPNGSSFDGTPVGDRAKETLVDNMGYQMHWHVPIDDETHWKYMVLFRYEGAMDRDYQSAQHANIDAEFHTPTHRGNRYLQDRQEMETRSYIGMGPKYYDHDRFATEAQGFVADRTVEHLGASDKPIIAMRRQLFAAIKAVQEGREPMMAGAQGSAVKDMTVRVGIAPAGADLGGAWWKRQEPAE